MNIPKLKQLEQRRPKQREITLTKYRGPIAMHARQPRATVYKYAPGGLRIDEEGQEKGAHNGTETKTKAER